MELKYYEQSTLNKTYLILIQETDRGVDWTDGKTFFAQTKYLFLHVWERGRVREVSFLTEFTGFADGISVATIIFPH